MALGIDTAPRGESIPPAGRLPESPTPKEPRGTSTIKGGAESAELRLLRLAENDMFPSLSGDTGASGSVSDSSEDEERDLDSPRREKLNERATSDFMRGLVKPTLPVKRNGRVKKYVHFFAESDEGRRLFSTWLRRSGRYRAVVSQELQKRNLPTDLEAVVFIESGFWPTARSPAGATGMWQFMPKTARAYGLTVESGYDERRSIWRSTEAATQHLADLYERFQSWDLALAAYNYGYDNVLARMKETGTEDFWAMSAQSEVLPRETALYVPKVLAVAVILNNLEHFGFDDVELAPPLEAAAVKLPPGIRLSMVARASGTSLRRLRELNPEIRGELLPDVGGPLVLHIPRTGVSRAKTMLPRLLDQAGADLDLDTTADFDWGRDEFDGSANTRLEGTKAHHKKKARASLADDDLSDSAETDTESSAGSEVSASHYQKSLESAAKGESAVASGSGNGKTRVIHQVQEGDNIWKLAESYKISRQRILRQNRLRDPNVLSVGRRLVFDVPPAGQEAEAAAPAPKK